MSDFAEKIIDVEPINLLEYSKEYPEFEKMQNCLQSQEYHPEGNVLEHTNLVLKKVLKICQTLARIYDKRMIYLGALFHDIGKPFTTNQELLAPGHDLVGANITREFLKQHFPMLDLKQREEVISLVECHMKPHQLVQNQMSDIRFKRLSLETNTKQLYHIARADLLGRTSNIVGKRLEELEVFKTVCQEHDIFGKYYEIPDTKDLSITVYNALRWSYLINEKEEIDLKLITDLYDQKPAELRILIGAPGTGKTTYAKNLFSHIERIDGNVLGEHNAFEELKKKIQERKSLIWDSQTTQKRKRRRKLINLARENGYYVSVVYFDFKLPEVLKRRKWYDSSHNEEDVKELFYHMEYPKPYEYDKLFIVNESVKFTQG